MTKIFSKWLWVGLPSIVFIVPYFFLAFFKRRVYREYMTGEFGFSEIGTIIFLFLAVIFAVLVLISSRNLKDVPNSKFFVAFISILALACFYFLGEEASWGQHIFKWVTPESWSEMNAHEETNLHNLAGWRLIFRDIPYYGLVSVSLIGGLVLPLMSFFKSNKIDSSSKFFDLIRPHYHCIVASAYASLIFIVTVIFSILGKSFFKELKHSISFFKQYAITSHSARECIECFLAMFLMFYFLCIWLRVKD